MTIRTVTVRLRAEVAAYLANMKLSEQGTKKLREEVERLDAASHALTKSGLITMAAGLPGLLAPAGAAVAALPGLAFTAAGSFGALALATNGVGDAMTAVAEGDAEKLQKALQGLSVEGRRFIAEYQRVKPVLDRIGDATQDSFFREFNGTLEELTRNYLPTMLTQLPRVSAAAGRSGRELAGWAKSPETVAKINRQLASAADLTGEWTRFLRSGLDMMLDLADAGREFNEDFVGGLADGAEAMRRWVANARATGQLSRVFENAKRIMSGLADITAKVGEILFDIMDNPALADGAMKLLEVLGMTLDVVHLLLTAFESLPAEVQSTVVTFAVLGGAALVVTGRVVALKASLDAAKLSALQTGAAMKGVGSFLGGPWGLAITAAIGLMTVFASRNKEAAGAAEVLRETLDKQTGAITAATRRQVVANLIESGAIESARRLKLNIDELIDTIMAGEAAYNQYLDTIYARPEIYENPDWDVELSHKFSGQAKAVDAAKQQWINLGIAMGGAGEEMDVTTEKIGEQTAALRKLADELRAQSDPVFALIQAQEGLRDAQDGYNDAVREHGKNSNEAKAASLELAKASVELAGAVAATADTFDGNLTSAMLATFRAAGLTERQIRDIETSFKAAAAAGSQFASDTYQVHLGTSQLDAAINKARQLRSLLGSFSASVNFQSGSYVSGRRWGGITEHARWGTLRQAQEFSAVSSGARYAFAEPATGGELFVPRKGDRERSLSLLDKGARWYGHTLAPMGGTAGGGGTQVIVQRIEHVHRITISGREQLSGWRREVELSGGSVQNLVGSRREG